MNKAQIRSIALEKLQQNPRSRRAAQSAKTRRNLMALLQRISFRSVLIYLPLPFEADLRPIFRFLRLRAKLYAPFAQGVSFKMVAYRLPLNRQKLGIFAPANSLREIKKVDILIAPCVAVDADFRRVGFGKGMFDRFFGSLSRKPIVIFTQPFFILSPKVCDERDMRGDYLVGAKGTICNLGKHNDGYCRNGAYFGGRLRSRRMVRNAQI